MISAEVSGARCEVPVPAGEPVPDAVVLNDGDLTYAEISFDPATLEALAGGGDERRRPADRGGVLERGLADGDVGRAGRRPTSPAW